MHEEVHAILCDAERRLSHVLEQASRLKDSRAVDAARYASLSLRDLRFKLSAGVRAADRRDRHKATYPRYEWRSDVVARVGWSKRHGQEYCATARRCVFEGVVRAMRDLVSRGSGPLPVERIILATARLVPEVTRKEIFFCLGVMQESGVIKQDHAGAYCVPMQLGRAISRIFMQAG